MILRWLSPVKVLYSYSYLYFYGICFVFYFLLVLVLLYRIGVITLFCGGYTCPGGAGVLLVSRQWGHT